MNPCALGQVLLEDPELERERRARDSPANVLPRITVE